MNYKYATHHSANLASGLDEKNKADDSIFAKLPRRRTLDTIKTLSERDQGLSRSSIYNDGNLSDEDGWQHLGGGMWGGWSRREKKRRRLAHLTYIALWWRQLAGTSNERDILLPGSRYSSINWSVQLRDRWEEKERNPLAAMARGLPAVNLSRQPRWTVSAAVSFAITTTRMKTFKQLHRPWCTRVGGKNASFNIC